MPEEFIGKWDELGIELDPEKTFEIVLISIDDFYNQLIKYGQSDIDLVRFSLAAALRQDLSFKHKSLFVNIDERTSCLLLQNNMENANGSAIELRKELSSVHTTINEEFNVSSTIAISSMGEGILSLPRLYTEALNLIEMKLILGQGHIIDQNTIIPENSDYHFPIEDEHDLVKKIKNRNFENLKENYRKIEEKLMKNNPIQIHLDLIRVASSLFDTIRSLESNSQLEFNLNFPQFIRELNQLDTMEQIRQHFYVFFDNIESQINAKKFSRSDENVDRIKEMIDEDYKNKELSSKLIADDLNMSTGYIRQLFKETCGVSISEYIFTLRIEKTADLIKSDNISFKEAMYDTGGSNYRYFLRRFKEYYGLSPSEFRKQ